MSKSAVVNKYAKSSGISKSTLSKVYQRGLGAYYSQGSRPGVSAHQWAQVTMRKGLYANIHAKRKRGEKMRKKGAKGAPTAANFRRAAMTVRKKK